MFLEAGRRLSVSLEPVKRRSEPAASTTTRHNMIILQATLTERTSDPRLRQEFALENLRREAKVVAKERIVTICVTVAQC